MTKEYFEDIELHRTHRLGEYLLKEKDIIDFAKSWDPLPFHIDPEFAGTSATGGVIASGFQLLAICQKLLIEEKPMAFLAGLGLDEVRFLAPVMPYDLLVLEIEAISKRESKSNPKAGIVTHTFRLLNQRDEPVLTYKGAGIVEKRNNL
jgi:acyl dehydratase